MYRRRRKRIWLLLVVILLFAFFILYQQSKRVKLTLLYWNDFHSATHPYPSVEEEGAPLVSGSAYFAAYLDSLRALNPNTMVICAGDEFTGDPLSTLTRGKAQIGLLNFMSPDVFTLGNHEFDYGVKNLKEALKLAQFPVVCANLYDREKKEFLVPPYLILNREKFKVAFIGLVTEGIEKEVKEWDGLEVLDAESTLASYMNELEDKSDIQILVSHMGLQKDKSIAEKVQGLEVIIGGHSHTVLRKPRKVNGTLICQAGSRGRYLGKLDLFLNPQGKILSYHNYLVETFSEGIQPDDSVKNKIEELEKNTGLRLDEVIGKLITPWIRKDQEESNIGNFLADAMKNYAKADVAFTNSGGIRKNLRAGPIKVRDIFEIAPFSDHLVAIELKGEELLGVLEKNCRKGIDLLQVSGVSYSYFLGRPCGERVIEAKVNNKELVPNKKYRAVINDYMLEHSKDYLGIAKQDLKYKFLPDLDRDVFIREVKKRKIIDSKIEGRIVRLEKVSGGVVNFNLETEDVFRSEMLWKGTKTGVW